VTPRETDAYFRAALENKSPPLTLDRAVDALRGLYGLLQLQADLREGTWTKNHRAVEARAVMALHEAHGAGRPERDALKPAITLLVKLGSIAAHVDELASPSGHIFDKIAVAGLLNDPEVKDWLAQMNKMAMIPRKR